LNSEVHSINTRYKSNLHRPIVNLRTYKKGTYYVGINIFKSSHWYKKFIEFAPTYKRNTYSTNYTVCMNKHNKANNLWDPLHVHLRTKRMILRTSSGPVKFISAQKEKETFFVFMLKRNILYLKFCTDCYKTAINPKFDDTWTSLSTNPRQWTVLSRKIKCSSTCAELP
jgi:hypothetical protein